MVKPNEIFEIKIVNEIFKRFLKNPKSLKLLRSIKDTGVAFYYTARHSESKIKGENKLAEAYHLRAEKFLDTWNWLGLQSKKPYNKKRKYYS